MKRLNGLIGMPVVCRSRRVGRALRGELTEDLTRLKGVWVGAGLRGTRYIPSEALQMLGQVAILADGLGERRRMDCPPLLRRAVSTDGTRLGAVTGAEIDELSFAVTALELSRGLWDDLTDRRLRVTTYTANRENGEVIIDLTDATKEEWIDEGRHDQGPDYRNADRLGGGDGVRRDELADRAQMEPEGEADRQLDLRPGG